MGNFLVFCGLLLGKNYVIMRVMTGKNITLSVMLLLLGGCAFHRTQTAAEPKYAAHLEMKSQKQIKKIMGNPVVVREEAPHQVWIYRSGDCATLVYFNETGTSQYVDVRGNCQQAVAGLF